MSNYIIGVDGGGTKTHAVLFDQNGTNIKEQVGGFSNLSVDSKTSIANIKEVIYQIKKDLNDSDVRMIVIGVAGYTGYEHKETLRQELLKEFNTKVHLVTDAELALYSVKQDKEQDVIMVLGGTGSVVMIKKDHQIEFIGGFGHILGDLGSGYHLVISALRNIINQHESNKRVTILSKAIIKEIGGANYNDIKKFVYNNNKSEIAKLSKFIAEHAMKDDKEAIKLFVDEGVYLFEQTQNAFKKLNTTEKVIVGIRGGFLLNAPYVKETLLHELEKFALNYEIDEQDLDPVLGAYYLAQDILKKRGDS